MFIIVYLIKILVIYLHIGIECLVPTHHQKNIHNILLLSNKQVKKWSSLFSSNVGVRRLARVSGFESERAKNQKKNEKKRIWKKGENIERNFEGVNFDS